MVVHTKRNSFCEVDRFFFKTEEKAKFLDVSHLLKIKALCSKQQK
jgi:hypothetical protein